MKITPLRLQKLFIFLKKNWFIGFAVVTYIFFTLLYMGPAFYNCNDAIAGFGDSTGGPIWRNSLEPDQPILGAYQTNTNYPKGESLYSPIGYASLVQSISMNIGSDVVGPVCAYNLYNIIGYLSTSIVMFGFILYLIKSRWIALLAGYAVAFTPYIQAKVGDHPSYGYGAILIAIIWLALHFIIYRKKTHGLLLGIVLGICAYFDPYFILFALTIALPIVFIWLWSALKGKLSIKTVKSITRKQVTAWAKPLLIAFVTFSLIVTPLVVVRVKDAGVIDTSVGSVRGDVVASAMLCSNTPLDYIMPDPENKLLVKLLGTGYTDANIAARNWCGNSESRVSVSLVLLFIVLLGVIVMLWEKLNHRKIRLDRFMPRRYRLIIASVIVIGIAALLLGLPPYIQGFITPSGLVLKITETWRIFGREYMLVNISIVIIAAVMIKYFSYLPILKTKRYITVLVFGLLFLGIVAEYQVTKPFQPQVFSYSKDVPRVYETVRDNSDIDVIAEYPIDRIGIEFDSMVYYQTMQGVHGKKLFNSAVVPDSNENIHLAMKDLTDPQTIPALRSLGIKYVVIHGVEQREILEKMKDVEIVARSNPPKYALTMVRADKDKDVVLAKILDGPRVSEILTIETGYVTNLKYIQSPLDTQFEVQRDTTLKVWPLVAEKHTNALSCFDIKMSNLSSSSEVRISVNGVPRWTGMVSNEYIPIRLEVTANDRITIYNTADGNMRLDNLGCVLQ